MENSELGLQHFFLPVWGDLVYSVIQIFKSTKSKRAMSGHQKILVTLSTQSLQSRLPVKQTGGYCPSSVGRNVESK